MESFNLPLNQFQLDQYQYCPRVHSTPVRSVWPVLAFTWHHLALLEAGGFFIDTI